MKKGICFAVALVIALACSSTSALASSSGVEHLHFKAGPYLITPGADYILVDRQQAPHPNVDGYMTRVSPELTLEASVLDP